MRMYMYTHKSMPMRAMHTCKQTCTSPPLLSSARRRSQKPVFTCLEKQHPVEKVDKKAAQPTPQA